LVLVDYPYSFNYSQLPTGHFPIVQVRITKPNNQSLGFDTEAYLDSGAERSIFDGSLISALEIELVNRNPKPYSTTTGNTVTGYMHRVGLAIAQVGSYNLEMGFSDAPIRRNLLGRDFFNLVQVGFREHQLQYFLNITP
jgi:hypothetical protein